MLISFGIENHFVPEWASPYTINVVPASEKWRILTVITDLERKISRNCSNDCNVCAIDPRATSRW